MLRLRSRAGKALPIILAASVLVAGGAGAGVGMFLGNRGSAAAEAGSEKDQKKKKKKKRHEPPAIVYSLGEMVVNLADADTLRYAKMTVALGFEEKVSEEKLKEETPVLRDVVIGVVTRKKFRDLHRPGGLEKLKEEIQAATEESLHEMTVSQVYFEGLAMQ